jgi:hypothetical protein
VALVACYECGDKVSTSAAACPHCGTPLKNGKEPDERVKEPRKSTKPIIRLKEEQTAGVNRGRSLFFRTIGTLIVILITSAGLCILGLGVVTIIRNPRSPEIVSAPQLSDSNVQPPEPAPAKSLVIHLPAGEEQFVRIVQDYIAKYPTSGNELQKSDLRRERKMHLQSILPIHNSFEVNDWIGRLTKMGTNSDGKAYLIVQLAPGIHIKTWNNALSDSRSNTLIEPGRFLYEILMNLREGEYVQFSGQFLPDDRDFIKESSLTERGSMERPEFIF